MGTSKRYFLILSVQDKSVDDLVTNFSYCMPCCALYFLSIFSLVKYLKCPLGFISWLLLWLFQRAGLGCQNVGRAWLPLCCSSSYHLHLVTDKLLLICYFSFIWYLSSSYHLHLVTDKLLPIRYSSFIWYLSYHLTICFWWQINFFLHNPCLAFLNDIYWKVLDMNYLGYTLLFHQHNDSLNHNADMICINLQECGATVDC